MSYEQFTNRYHRYTQTARSLSEALRDADYATPIWRCETDWDRFKSFCGEMFVWMLLFVAVFGVFGTGLWTWITR
jgi:hypothetical protein